jgi:hypothetical protein
VAATGLPRPLINAAQPACASGLTTGIKVPDCGLPDQNKFFSNNRMLVQVGRYMDFGNGYLTEKQSENKEESRG